MARKKKNPSRIPINVSEPEVRRMVEEEADRICLCGWTLVLCALADRWETTAESLVTFCELVNRLTVKPQANAGITERVSALESLTGASFPFHKLNTSGIRTKRDLYRLLRLTDESALHSMFALIADTVLTYSIMEVEDTRILFQKVRLLTDSLFEDRITLQDLRGVLEDEFDLTLVEEKSGIHIRVIRR